MDLTQLLNEASGGDAHAADRLLDLVYLELRNLAHGKMSREAPGNTLQPTALVHEAWLRLSAGGATHWPNRAYFFAAAAEAMRRILVEGARRRSAEKRGGDLERVDLKEAEEIAAPDDDSIVAVDDALEQLAKADPEAAAVVKLHYFVGLDYPQIAEVLGISESTVKRRWGFAKAWLFRRVNSTSGPA